MPPWFADPCCGKFSNDRLLDPGRNRLDRSMGGRRIAGRRPEIRPRRPAPGPIRLEPRHPRCRFRNARSRSRSPPKAPSTTSASWSRSGFKEDRWVQAVEVRPGARAVVHHVVVYIRGTGPNLGDRIHQSRYSAGLRSWNRARIVARRHGQADPRRRRPDFRNPLHTQRKTGRRSDPRRRDLFANRLRPSAS